MRVSGRPRKPTQLKVIAGTDRAARRKPHEPTPKRARLGIPAHLGDRAKLAWPAFVDVLDSMQVLTVADGFALERLCEAYADVRHAQECRPAEMTYETTNATGGVMHRPNPEYAMLADADRRLAMWIARFGLSPSDRARVSAATGEAEGNPFAKLG